MENSSPYLELGEFPPKVAVGILARAALELASRSPNPAAHPLFDWEPELRKRIIAAVMSSRWVPEGVALDDPSNEDLRSRAADRLDDLADQLDQVDMDAAIQRLSKAGRLPADWVETAKGKQGEAQIALTRSNAPIAKVLSVPASAHRFIRDTRELLKQRDWEMLVLLRRGASNKFIARELNLPDAVVKIHLKSLFRKLHVSSRSQAAIMYELIRPDDINSG